MIRYALASALGRTLFYYVVALTGYVLDVPLWWYAVAATIVGPRTRSFRAYHDHEAIGAAMVRGAGSEPATVDLVAQRGPAFAALDASDHA